MSEDSGSRHTGRKIWYGIAIAVCGLVILLSVVGIVGTWVVGSTLSTTVTELLVVVENTAAGLSAGVERIDQGMGKLEETAATIRSATDQLSQNVTDQGLLLTLLPEDREQALVAQVTELRETINSFTGALQAGLDLYRSIDSLPFVSLPQPQEDTVARLEKTITDIQAMTQQIADGIQAFRAGVTDGIARVTTVLDEITTRLSDARQSLTQLNNALDAVQALAARVRSLVPLIFATLSVFSTLFLSWIIYTQMEVIRAFNRRWKSLGGAVGALPAGGESVTPAIPPEQTEAGSAEPSVEEPPVADAESAPEAEASQTPEDGE